MRTAMIGLGLAWILVATTGCSSRNEGRQVSASSVGYTVLDNDGHQLEKAFDRAKGSVRLVLLVDPTCPVCLRGLADIHDDLLAKDPDPRLQTFIVYEPVIGGTANDIAPTAVLTGNTHIHRFWNPGGGFGRLFAKAVGLKRHGKYVYAWDVWTIYGPDAAWKGIEPPRPALLMHQLQKLDDPAYRRLDGKVFARTAHALLMQLHPYAPAHDRGPRT